MMTRVILSNRIWVAICDGAKAIAYENIGDPEYPNLETRHEMAQTAPPDRDIHNEPKGRVYGFAGGPSSSVERKDAHQTMETTFIKSFATYLDENVRNGTIPKLILAAPPRALGILREHLSSQTRAVVTTELDHDYTKIPAYELEKILKKHA